MEQQAAALQLLTVGKLLFGDDLDATCHTLLPGSRVGDYLQLCCCTACTVSMCARYHVTMVHTCCVQVQDLAILHTQAYASSTAEGYISKLRAAGLQPGALLSGSARNRLVTLLPGTSSAADPAIVYEENVLRVLASTRTDVLTRLCCRCRQQQGRGSIQGLRQLQLVLDIPGGSTGAVFQSCCLLKRLPANTAGLG